jgi:RteC protein
MEQKWKTLYDELQRECNHTLHGRPITIEDTEKGYKIAFGYWEKAKALVCQYGFHNENQEIGFFSSVKPLFTGHLEYFMLLYQHRLFCPPEKIDAGAFRHHELDKIQRFREVHASFIRFYRSRNKDVILAQGYFLRRTFNPDRRTFSRPFDANPDYFTNGDWIVTQFIGNLRYQRFLLNETRQGTKPRGPEQLS